MEQLGKYVDLQYNKKNTTLGTRGTIMSKTNPNFVLIIVSLMKGYAGRRHDAGIFRESRVYGQLEMKVVFNDEEKYTLYGDQAYGLMELLLCPYPRKPQNLPEYQRQFNTSMKVFRVTVEWGFQKIVSEFEFVDFKKNHKLLLQDVEALYKTAVISTNSHTCLYGSQTADYFNIGPRSLKEYFEM
ncbi:hypothetical protein JTB14_017309 [Gonioctena quinquepunctata]|nr:hypothetical protein JTB14_017309 [Gonioctena quinquepunctata]